MENKLEYVFLCDEKLITLRNIEPPLSIVTLKINLSEATDFNTDFNLYKQTSTTQCCVE